MTHDGQSAARVTGACFVDGPGGRHARRRSPAGRRGLREVPVEALQAALRRDGAWLGDGALPAP